MNDNNLTSVFYSNVSVTRVRPLLDVTDDIFVGVMMCQIKMYLSDYSILELFGRFITTVCTVYGTIVHLSTFLSGVSARTTNPRI